MAVGALVVWEGTSYTIGSVERMGPGFFPTALGSLLILLGAGLMTYGWISPHGEGRYPRIWSAAAVLVSIGIFGLLIERFGLAPAVAAVVMVSSLADPLRRRVEVIVLAACGAAITVGIFVWTLGLPIPAVKW